MHAAWPRRAGGSLSLLRAVRRRGDGDGRVLMQSLHRPASPPPAWPGLLAA